MARQPLADVLPQGDSKDELTIKMLELYHERFKTHTHAFICELLNAMDEKQLKELYLKLRD